MPHDSGPSDLLLPSAATQMLVINRELLRKRELGLLVIRALRGLGSIGVQTPTVIRVPGLPDITPGHVFRQLKGAFNLHSPVTIGLLVAVCSCGYSVASFTSSGVGSPLSRSGISAGSCCRATAPRTRLPTSPVAR